MTVSSVSTTQSADPAPVIAASDAASADRFLKLLVAQMQNQDPLSPMDNAQVTSQMAQINTVSGIEKLNVTVQGLSSQFVQMQALQGAGLVGHDVIVPGKLLAITDGFGQGGFELAGPADSVKVEILAANGQVADTIDLGAQSSGLHSFAWPSGTADETSGLSFRVTAKSGAAAVGATPLMRDRVVAVSMGGNALMLELTRSGSVAYADVKSFN
ncbi:MAG TPA: flagellar hook capping FlgD N-terminal domain-containing protein [Burkholderiaceae bacterium]|jgi:flagellar basal-body rod modification protein FlgD|nr:flagellar hook capping FlgD N-terminal domain-containing protein [Burkholderiaceae bacterium]